MNTETKRKFFHPVLSSSYGHGVEIPEKLKDGDIEEFEDILVPKYDESGNFLGYFPDENSHHLSLRSKVTGEVTTFVKWPNAYFGDKLRGPFTTREKAKKSLEWKRTLKFDHDGKRL